jgi:Transglutaminase-like superfamily
VREVLAHPCLFLECWAEILLAIVAIRSPLRAWYLESHAIAAARPAPHPEMVFRMIGRAAGRHLKRITCLERSAAGVRILRRHGSAAALRIGVRNVAGIFESHAWVEVDQTTSDELAAGFGVMQGGVWR